jgi:hypothetical protein
MLSPEHRSETLESNGIEYRGVATVDVYGGAMEVFAINDGLFARWNCDGELSQVFRRDEEAGWVALDPEAFDKRYRLAIWIIPEEPHVGAF